MARCPICKQTATERFGLKLFCGYEHAAEWAKSAQERKKKVEASKRIAEVKKRDRAIKERLKSRGEWLKELQVIFNKYIRLRDAQKNCISCGGKLGSKYDAGHYKSCGAHPELRFEELNVHAQCVRCNQHLSGNLIGYRKGLLIRIGTEKVEWLESKHEPLKLTIEEIKELKKVYQDKCKALTGLIS